MNAEGRRRPGLLEGLTMWLGMFIVANIAMSIVLLVTGESGLQQAQIPIWATAVAVSSMWAVFLVGIPRYLPFEETSLSSAFPHWFRMRDVAVGVPLGIFCQYVLMNIVNWPLTKLFPHTFTFDEISQRAKDLSATAPGWWKILLVLVVVIGAPIVEEIVYRGAVQSHLQRTAGTSAAIVGTAVLFAAIHMSPLEFPGLFVFALVLSEARRRSGTLGLSIVTHMSFNAAGLVLVLMK